VLQRNITINWEPLSPILNGPKISEWIKSIRVSLSQIWLLWGFKCNIDIPHVSQRAISGIGLIRLIASVISAILNIVLSAIWPRQLCQTYKISELISIKRRASYYLKVVLRNQHPFLLITVIVLFPVLILQCSFEN